MPRTCSVCTHEQRPAIDRALVSGEPFRDIAKCFPISVSALDRHKRGHLPATLARAKAAQETSDAVDVMAELQRCFERVNLLFDACDRWLRDADDPSRYDIGPRATELDVTYDEVVLDRKGNPRTVRRKQKLAELLETIESDSRSVVLVETKYADPRELVLKTSNRLQGQMELLSKLVGHLSDGPVINIHMSPEWLTIQTTIISALQPYPEARQTVADALTMIEGDARHGST
jgi:hypothetical protein